MQSDIKSIEEGIKKDAKASQDRFAKAVADNVFDSVVGELTTIVNQLDNKTLTNQMKAKLEKIKEILETMDFQVVLDRINELSMRIESDGESILSIDSKMAEHDIYFQEIKSSVTTMDLLLKEIHEEMGDGFFQSINNDIEQKKVKIDELKSIEENIFLNVKGISSSVKDDNGFSVIELLKNDIDLIGKISLAVEKIYTYIMNIDFQKQFDLIQKVADTTSGNEVILVEMKSILSDFSQVTKVMREIKLEITEIQSVVSEGFDKCDNAHLIKEIGDLKNTIKYLFWFNGFISIGIVGMALLLLFK